MSKQLDDKIEELIKLTFNHDPDRQYMAIMELAEIIKTQSDKIAPAVLQKIIDNILKFLQDQNKILHGLAIDRLSKIITKIPTEGNRRICQQMISKLSDLHTLTEFRGIYATALKSIIKQVSFEQGSKLAQLLIDVIKAVLATQNGTHPNSRKIQQLLIEVVDTFITKWPTMIDKIDFPKIKFAKLLLNNIVKEGHLTKSNASSICLGRLAGTMKQNDLQQILYKPGGIIPYIDNKSVEDKKKKIAIDTFRLILQHYNRQMQKYVKDIFEFLFKSIRFYKSDKAVESDNDRLEVVCEIIEQLLFGVLSLLEHFPKELKLIILNNQQYGKDIRQMVSYCPIGSVNYMSNKVERDDDDDYDDQDFQNEDGACSYRVRSASTLIVGQLCRLDSNMCLEIIHFQKFYDRLLENSSEVRQSAFKAFSSLVHTITVEENTKKIDIQNIEVFPIKRARTNYKEVALDLVERLMKKLNEVTSKNSIDPKTTGEVAKLLSSVCQSFAASISDNPKLYEQVTVLLQKELARNSSFPQIKSHIIDAFGYLFMKSFNERPNFTLDSCTKLIKSCIDQNSNEVSLAAFKAIDNLLENNILEYGGQPDTVKDLGKIFVDQLKVTSYKTQTKKYIVQCVSQLLSNYNKLLDPQQINDLINQLISKLETEASKKSIIVVFTKFQKDFPINKALTQTLNKAILAVSNGYINHQNQSIAVAAQQAVAKMIDILGKSFPKQNAVNLVQAARHIKGTFPLFMHSILNLYPDALKQYLQELFSFEEIPVDIVQKLITSKVLTNDECLKLVKAKLRNQNIDTMVKVLSLLGTDIKQYSKQVGQQTPMGRLALRFLGDFGGIQTYNQLKKYALGSYQTQTKQQGSIALGSLVSRHFSKLMPDLINNTLKSLTQQHVLNVFLSVREAIVRSGAQNYDEIDKLFEYILAEIGSGNISKDAVLNLIAESVARMVSIKHEHSERLLDFIYKSKNSSHRYLFAKMFQSLSQQLMENTDYIRGKIALLIKMLAETDVNIKTETLKSLVHLTEAVPHAVLYSLDEETFKLIRQCTVIDKSLFKTQVMVVTVVVDYGRPIRFQAFGFFETAINKPTNEAFELQSQHPLILQSALDGLEEQKQLGMIQVRLNLIKTLTDKYAYVLVGEAARLKKAIEPRILNMDPEDRFAKNILGTILNIYRNMKKEFSVEMEELYQSISKKPELKEIITHIEKEYE